MSERDEYFKRLDDLLQPNYEWLRNECRKTNPKYRDELFQETLVRAMKYAKNYEFDQDSIRGWLKVVMKNQSRTINSAVRKESFKRADNVVTFTEEAEESDIFDEIVPEKYWQQSAEDTFMGEIDDDIINKALNSLDEEFQDVIRLNMIQGFTYAEIAEILNIPQNTVGSRVSRARKKLRKQLIELAKEYGIKVKDEEK
ncbi:MAG: hypothetical protein RIQ88_775 [Actinomycetota bacterium]